MSLFFFFYRGKLCFWLVYSLCCAALLPLARWAPHRTGSAALLVQHQVRLEDSSARSYTTVRTQMPILNRSFICFYHMAFIQHVLFISSRHYASRFLSARPWLLFSESFFISSRKFKKKKKREKKKYAIPLWLQSIFFQLSKVMLCLHLLIIPYRICCKILYLRLQNILPQIPNWKC